MEQSHACASVGECPLLNVPFGRGLRVGLRVGAASRGTPCDTPLLVLQSNLAYLTSLNISTSTSDCINIYAGERQGVR